MGLLAKNETSLTCLVRRLVFLEFFFFTISAFFWTVLYGVELSYHIARMRHYSGYISVITQLSSCYWTLALSDLQFKLMEEYDADAVLGVLALARANEIDFDVGKEPVWFLLSFENRIMNYLRAFYNLGALLLRML